MTFRKEGRLRSKYWSVFCKGYRMLNLFSPISLRLTFELSMLETHIFVRGSGILFAFECHTCGVQFVKAIQIQILLGGKVWSRNHSLTHVSSWVHFSAYRNKTFYYPYICSSTLVKFTEYGYSYINTWPVKSVKG